MSRATGLAIRRAQMQANLFAPVATVDADGTERILGKPVFYDVNAPSLPTATSSGVVPILFGDFKAGVHHRRAWRRRDQRQDSGPAVGLARAARHSGISAS